MGVVQKGIILTLEGETDINGNPTKAKVQSTSAEGTSTLPITIPWYLRGEMGRLEKGTEIAFVIFEDLTGIIVSRIDGNWDGMIEDNITIKKNLVVDADIKLGEKII
ncbi:MAG: pre-mRNA-splicing factor [Lachnospiraceae bacterium]|nr:pre-mRNA-splicing factor [Lachnospiraceae bacterium]MDE7204060.1 pre-mRNA-splicing factor [Lachnospiraceae bacterium]